MNNIKSIKSGDIVKLISVCGEDNVTEYIRNRFLGKEYTVAHIEKTRPLYGGFDPSEGCFCILTANFGVEDKYKKLVLNGAVVELK